MASSISLPDDIAQYLERIASEGNRAGFIRTLPYDYEILAENLLDPAHVPFSHHGADPNFDRSSGGVFSMTPVPPVTPNAVASVQATVKASSYPQNAWLEFVDPALIMQTNQNIDLEKSDFKLLFPLSPVRKGWSRIIIHSVAPGKLSGHKVKESGLTKLIFSMPAAVHMMRNNILDGDSVFLHLQDQLLRKERKSGWTLDTYFTPTSADYMVLRFRNWLKKEGGGGPFGPSDNQESSSISRRELLDRYDSYTLQNKEGQKALAFVNKTAAVCDFVCRASLVVVGACLIRSMHTGLLYKWQTLAGLVVSALFFSVGRYLREKIVPLFYFVDYVHADKN